MTALLQWLEARLSEASTYAGLAGLLGALHLATSLAPVITNIGMAVAGVLAIIIPEATSNKG
jgi:hypothetical protein